MEVPAEAIDQQPVSPYEGVLAGLILPNQESVVAWFLLMRTLERRLNQLWARLAWRKT